MTNAIPTDITVLKQLTALRLDVNIWSARKKLTPADFGTLDLPPEKLASLGSKKVCNPEDLRVFATLKARAISLLDRHGIRFLGGCAAGTRASQLTYENSPSVRTSPPRMVPPPVDLGGIESRRRRGGKGGFSAVC